jgi:HPt (histidine-containing phosphotransfer) domain-containing protein
MPPKKDDAPTIATYPDHEVIVPPHGLRRVVSQGAADDPDPVARAEQALQTLSSEFGNWMVAECDRLDAARRQIHSDALNEKTRDLFFHAAHDIKGEAATFGYPLAASIAESLCRLLEHTPEMTRIPLALIDQHVDAIRAIVRENARPGAEQVGVNLFKRLRQVTDDFLLQENKDRLAEMDGILSPPIAPHEGAA